MVYLSVIIPFTWLNRSIIKYRTKDDLIPSWWGQKQASKKSTGLNSDVKTDRNLCVCVDTHIRKPAASHFSENRIIGNKTETFRKKRKRL